MSSAWVVCKWVEAAALAFGQSCANILFPNDQEIQAMYQDSLFIKHKKAFNANNISKTMMMWTEYRYNCFSVHGPSPVNGQPVHEECPTLLP